MKSGKTVNFCGESLELHYISGRQLTRLARAVYELLKQSRVDLKQLFDIEAPNYGSILLVAINEVLTSFSSDMTLNESERLFYGVLGSLIGKSAEDVADAPHSDLMALAIAVYEQEAQTQAGKYLIGMLAKFERSHSASTDSAASLTPSQIEKSEEQSSEPKKEKKRQAIGTPQLGS